jgi:acetylcholinesterase
MLTLTFILVLLCSLANAAPQLKLGNTTLFGQNITILNQEFYGGRLGFRILVLLIMFLSSETRYTIRRTPHRSVALEAPGFDNKPQQLFDFRCNQIRCCMFTSGAHLNHVFCSIFSVRSFNRQGLASSSMSEDCLTVNVFRPSGLSVQSKLPVLVWIYGGRFIG